jgi:hypothetical protein
VTSTRSEKTVASKSAAGEANISGFRLFFHPGLHEIEAYLLNRLRGSARYEIYQHLKQCRNCKYRFYQLVR